MDLNPDQDMDEFTNRVFWITIFVMGIYFTWMFIMALKALLS